MRLFNTTSHVYVLRGLVVERLFWSSFEDAVTATVSPAIQRQAILLLAQVTRSSSLLTTQRGEGSAVSAPIYEDI